MTTERNDRNGTASPRFTFPGWDCPCGSLQLDPDRLYCPACVAAKSIRIAEEMSLQRGWGIRGYIDPPTEERGVDV